LQADQLNSCVRFYFSFTWWAGTVAGRMTSVPGGFWHRPHGLAAR